MPFQMLPDSSPAKTAWKASLHWIACDLRHRTLGRSLVRIGRAIHTLYNTLLINSLLGCSGMAIDAVRTLEREWALQLICLKPCDTAHWSSTSTDPSPWKAQGYRYHMQEGDNNDARGILAGNLHEL